MTQDDTISLFTQYLNVINAALAEHKDAMPYKAILEASEKVFGGTKVGVAVYADDPDTPFDYFTIRFREGSYELVSHGKQEPDVAGKVSRDYLEKVVENAQDYIDHPIKLDWDWLKSRLGIDI